jgi:hypothetical protein
MSAENKGHVETELISLKTDSERTIGDVLSKMETLGLVRESEVTVA